MIDILRFVPLDTPVDVMVHIQLANVFSIRSGHSPHCFGVSDSFTYVLRYWSVLGEKD